MKIADIKDIQPKVRLLFYTRKVLEKDRPHKMSAVDYEECKSQEPTLFRASYEEYLAYYERQVARFISGLNGTYNYIGQTPIIADIEIETIPRIEEVEKSEGFLNWIARDFEIVNFLKNHYKNDN